MKVRYGRIPLVFSDEKTKRCIPRIDYPDPWMPEYSLLYCYSDVFDSYEIGGIDDLGEYHERVTPNPWVKHVIILPGIAIRFYSRESSGEENENR